MDYNGSAVLAMAGDGCVAIASDRRFGVQMQTIACDFQRIFQIHDQLYLGLAGLATDVQTLSQRLQFRHKLYQLREERDMRPETFANMTSSMLYEKRFGPYFVEPIIAGLQNDGTPYLATMDLLGAMQPSKDFIVAGTAGENLYGACESMWRADLSPEELFEVVSQSLIASVDRDASSGWGGIVYIITQHEIIKRTLKARMD